MKFWEHAFITASISEVLITELGLKIDKDMGSILGPELKIDGDVNVSGSLAIPGFTQEAINKLVNIIGDSVASSTATKIDNAITMWQREQDGRVA